MEVPEVDGIEGAAEQGDFSRRGHGWLEARRDRRAIQASPRFTAAGNVASFSAE